MTDDIIEFLIENRVEIKSQVEKLSASIYLSERLFANNPDMFEEILYNARQKNIINILLEHFPHSAEDIYLRVDNRCVSIIFDNRNK